KGSSAGIVARYSGPGDANMYEGRLVHSGSAVYARIYRNLGGKLKPLFNQKVTTATGTLRFEVVGSSLKLFLNGSLVAFANDSTIGGPGSAGIYATSLTGIDNFSAAAAPARVDATLPFGDDFDTSDNGDQLNLHWTAQAGNFTLQGQAAVGKGKLNL